MWWTQVGVVSKVSELVGKIVEIWMVVGVAGGCSSEVKQVAPMRKILLLVVDGWRGVESQHRPLTGWVATTGSSQRPLLLLEATAGASGKSLPAHDLLILGFPALASASTTPSAEG